MYLALCEAGRGKHHHIRKSPFSETNTIGETSLVLEE